MGHEDEKAERQAERARERELFAPPRPPRVELNLHRLTRAHVEAVCAELGPDHAWVRLGISRSTLYLWRRRWREMDAKREREEKAEAT